MITKSGSAKWEGDLRSGRGHVSTETGALSDQPYGFKSRFEGGTETNPEELVGAAHAACFSMALSMVLGDYDLVADSIDTKATVSLEQKDGGYHIPKVHLDVTAAIADASEEQFKEAAKIAKENCPISKLFTAEITLNAKLA
ncbi:OsmC family protein [Sulfitobacter sp. D35]|uniref:OsmC family protein n=1 Tax=Sulfitobacter sp. D35 TaxID=3083252 RepID=UPI00296E7A58|nr:OsmC family protein [Sulfitobacter sp. D35]MDW4497693.1 OsmC family protein [Sulfitobacter sp. D35]